MSNPDPAESSGPSVRFIPLTFQLIQKQLNKQEFWWGHAEILGLEALAGIWILQDLSKLLLIFCPQNFNMCWTNRLSASGCAPAIKSPHWIPNFTWSCWNKVGAPLLCCWFFIPSNVLPSSWWRGNLIPKLLEESMTTPPSVSESSKLFSDPKPNQTKPSLVPPQLCREKQRNKHSPCKVTQLQTSPGTPGLSSLAKPSCSPPTDGRSTSSPGALGMSQMCSSTGSQLLTRHTACSGSQFPPIWGGFDLLACSVIAIPWVYGSQRTCESSWEQQGEKPL